MDETPHTCEDMRVYMDKSCLWEIHITLMERYEVTTRQWENYIKETEEVTEEETKLEFE